LSSGFLFKLIFLLSPSKTSIMKKLYCSLILLLFFSFGIIAQVGDGGQPVSFGLPAQSINAVEAVNLVKPNMQQLLEEDAINDELGRAYRVGTLIQVNLSPMNSGTWTTLSDGSKVWQLQIKSKDALALGIYFSEDVVLPAGSKLFAFNKNKNHVIGAYTANTPRFQAMQMVEGDVFTLEYHAPAHVLTYPTININEVGYFYRGVEDFVNQFRTVPHRESRKAARWMWRVRQKATVGAEQIRSVVHYTFNQGGGMFVCSAATINNTANDCKPYILNRMALW
jgi:lysyl endopeptidase